MKTFYFCFLILLISAACHSEKAYRDKSAARVYVQQEGGGYTLVRNGKPFAVRGASGCGHVKELKAAGGNTLRVYDTVGLAVLLDTAQRYGIAVVVDLPLPKSNYIDEFYADSSYWRPLMRDYLAVVKKHRDHPALLFWMLGNELDFPFKPYYRPFYKAYREMLSRIQQADPDHPVSTSLTNFTRRKVFNLLWKVPDIDFISINTFGRLRTLHEDIKNFAWYWKGPYLLSEWGNTGYWAAPFTAWAAPIEDASWSKARQIEHYYQNHMPRKDPRFLGSLVFYWGQKNEGTDTWFNFFTRQGQPTEAYRAIMNAWSNKAQADTDSTLQYTLIDKRGAKDNIVLHAGRTYTAQALLHQDWDSSWAAQWRLLPEDWYSLYLDETPAIQPLPIYLRHIDGPNLRFTAPPQSGAYRLYFEIFNGKYSAQANTPFYVISSPSTDALH